jgi:DNA-directed RNA polymerase specialized sigma24 family protein
MRHVSDPGRGSLGAWLHAVAVNRCKELLRARRRRPTLTLTGSAFSSTNSWKI